MKPETRRALEKGMAALIEEWRRKPDTDLSIERVAKLAGVSRATAYRAPDLVAELKRVEAMGASTSAANASEQLRTAQREVKITTLQATISVMANHIQALTLAVLELEDRLKTSPAAAEGWTPSHRIAGE